MAFSDMFKKSVAFHLSWTKPDHRPILLELFPDDQMCFRGKRRYEFKFDENWARHPECKEIIKASWEGARNSLITFDSRLALCSRKLSKWGKSINRNLINQIRKQGSIEEAYDQQLHLNFD